MKPSPSSANRIMDAAALLMVVGGVALFGFARKALMEIGAETRVMPKGISAVAVADYHVAQSKMGLFIISLGVLTGIVAAVRHKLRT